MLRSLLLPLGLLLIAPLPAAELRTLSWSELIPADALPPPPPPLLLHDPASAESAPPAVQLMPAAPVVDALDGQRVRLPGYLVPLAVDTRNRARTFLLVPYFGACIHVPPPPSNQIVQVHSDDGLALDELWQPFWVTGELHVEHSSSELAEAGYRMPAAQIRPYQQ